ncbi:MAG TPA: hypothetical protein VHD32_05690 [Candidatus Didemnitutus sp.]|nr:hypothetical protein [Candidatus Didemnitutus sp.]
MKSCLGATAILGTLMLTAVAPAQEWRMDATYTWATNLSRTSYAPDRENGALYDLTVAGAWHRQINADWLATTEIDATAEQVHPFPLLDNNSITGEVDLRRKFGLGPFAPTLTFSGKVGYVDYHDPDRSHDNFQLATTLGKRLTESWRVSATGTWNDERASAATYSIRNQRLAVETAWDIFEGCELSAGASRWWGQLTANANEDIFAQAEAGSLGPVVADYYRSVAHEHSNAYDTDWLAYRIDCRADFWWVGASYALNDNTSIPLRYESAYVVNRAQVSYRSEFWSLSVVHRF